MKNCEKNEMGCGLDPLSWTQRLENWFLNHFLYVPSTSVSECKDTVEESEEPLKEFVSGGSNVNQPVDILPSGSIGYVACIHHTGIVFLCPKCWQRQDICNYTWPVRCEYCGAKF